jgi:hypothetical protein
MAESPDEWEWFGQAGHFVGDLRCRWHLHTHVNGYCVSSVGEWYHRSSLVEVSFLCLYETKVFDLINGKEEDLSALESKGYNDPAAADRGHMEICAKYAAMNPPPILTREAGTT